MTDLKPQARAVCEHSYASHCYRGMSIRLCMLCHQPDWDDLERQMREVIPVPPVAAALEPPARLTEAQCDRLRQMAGEWGYAVSAVRKALEFAAARIRTREGDGIIGAAWEALKILEGSEEGSRHG